MAERSGGSAASGGRDEFIDLCRAFSLVVVVIWHWVFTIVIWTPRGPSASNPIGFTTGLWLLTWFLQVMPLFFFVGGFAHSKVWEKVSAGGGGYATFVVGRVKRLLIPSIALVVTWVVLLNIFVWFGANRVWMGKAVLLIVSPLWFIAVYIVLVALAPFALALHRRFGPLVIVLLVGAAAIVDTGRFKNGLDWVSFLNLVIVWGACHQLGFFYERLVNGDRMWSWSMVAGGLLGLIALTNTGLYPASMVGVPGARVSNMGPPTLCIIALCSLQAGLAVLLRPWVMERLEEPTWQRANEVINRFALPLFLFHTTGMAIAFGIMRAVGYDPPLRPTLAWWAQRPIWLIVPLICTLPIIVAFGRTPIGRAPGRAKARAQEPEPELVAAGPERRW